MNDGIETDDLEENEGDEVELDIFERRLPWSLFLVWSFTKDGLWSWQSLTSAIERNDAAGLLKEYINCAPQVDRWRNRFEFVADEFAVISQRVVSRSDFAESFAYREGRGDAYASASMHGFVIANVENLLWRIRNYVVRFDRTNCDPLHVIKMATPANWDEEIVNEIRNQATWLQGNDALRCLDEFTPNLQSWSVISAALQQEICRAADRRRLTGVRYAIDDWYEETEENEEEQSNHEMLSKSEAAIMEIIKAAGSRLTTKQVLATLEKQNGVASEGTTKVTLAGLVRRRLLDNRTDTAPRGYGLPEWDD